METSEPQGASAPAPVEAHLALAQVIDHALLDSDGRRAGRVDDLEFGVRRAEDGGVQLVLRGIVSGPMARPTHPWISRFARLCYRAIGIADPHPARVPWQRVEAIDAFVHLDVDREGAGLQLVDIALRQRLHRRRRSRRSG